VLDVGVVFGVVRNDWGSETVQVSDFQLDQETTKDATYDGEYRGSAVRQHNRLAQRCNVARKGDTCITPPAQAETSDKVGHKDSNRPIFPMYPGQFRVAGIVGDKGELMKQESKNHRRYKILPCTVPSHMSTISLREALTDRREETHKSSGSCKR
jgi:hypothetical protein